MDGWINSIAWVKTFAPLALSLKFYITWSGGKLDVTSLWHMRLVCREFGGTPYPKFDIHPYTVYYILYSFCLTLFISLTRCIINKSVIYLYTMLGSVLWI